jgi:hypothetical protein
MAASAAVMMSFFMFESSLLVFTFSFNRHPQLNASNYTLIRFVMQDVENLDFHSDKFIEGFASASEDCGIIAQKKKKMGLGKWKKIQ